MTSIAAPLAIIAALDGIGFLIFFLVAFISWLINFLSPKQQGKVNPQKPVGQRLDQRGKQIQTELEKFLQQTREIAEQRSKENPRRDKDVEVVEMPQAGGNRRAAPPPQQRRVQPAAAKKPISSFQNDIEKRRQELNAGRKKPDQKQPSSGNSTGVAGNNISGRHIQTSVDSQPGRRLGNLTSTLHPSGSEPLTSGTQVQSSTGSDSRHAPMLLSTAQQSDDETTGHRASKASEMGRLMRSHSHVRNAIIVNEILNRPLALRRPR